MANIMIAVSNESDIYSRLNPSASGNIKTSYSGNINIK